MTNRFFNAWLRTLPPIVLVGTSSVSGHFVGSNVSIVRRPLRWSQRFGPPAIPTRVGGYACRCGSRGLEWIGNGTQRFSGFPTFSIVKPKDGKQMRNYRMAPSSQLLYFPTDTFLNGMRLLGESSPRGASAQVVAAPLTGRM